MKQKHTVPSRISQVSTTMTLAAALVLTGCGGKSEGVVVAHYPTYTSPPVESVDGVAVYEYGESNRYWSTDIYLEPLDIARLWENGDLDYVLITAKARLPTPGKPLVREFPLYTYENGVVQSHAGVDLLQKFPIVVGQRNELSITLEVTHFKKAEEIALVRKVLDQTSKLAAPYLDNYPVASQIIGGATSIIDALTADDDRLKNSFTTTIHASDIVHSETLSKVFLLVPLPTAKAPAKPSSSDTGYTYAPHLVRCCDKSEAMCKLPPKGAQNIATQHKRIEKLDKDLARFRRNQEDAERNLMLHRRERLDLGAQPPTGDEGQRKQQAVAAEEKKEREKELEDELRKADEVRSRAERELESLRSRQLHCLGASPINYRDHRINDVVYVAMHFVPSDNVHDHMAFIRSDGCAITESDVQSAREYVTSNEFLFYPDDVVLAHRSYENAATLLRMRHLNGKGAVGDIVQLLANMQQPRPAPHFPTFFSAQPSQLARQLRQVHDCLHHELRNVSPSREALDVINVYREGHRDCQGGAACRLDQLGHVLVKLAEAAGRSKYSVEEENAWQGERNGIVRALHTEAFRLSQLQKDTVKGLLAGGCRGDRLTEVLELTSIYCNSCLNTIRATCGDTPTIEQTIAGLRARRVSWLDERAANRRIQMVPFE